MKTSLLPTLLCGALACTSLATAQSSINMPAVPNGSNWSRAPFPAQRPFDDTKGPDGEAFDTYLSAEPALPPPPPRYAIFQSSTPVMAVASTEPTVTAPAVAVAAPEPALSPTGRTSVGVAAGVDAAAVGTQIRSASLASREQILTDLENRVSTNEKAFRDHGAAVDAGTREAYKAAHDDVKEKAKALKKSVAAARKAGPEDWENARSRLAADYDAYAAALSRLDTTVGSAP